MRPRIVRYALLLSLLSPLPSAAQQQHVAKSAPAARFPGGDPYRLQYDHVHQTLTLLAPGGRTLNQWDVSQGPGPEAPLAQVPPDHPVAVEILDANPLLYEYDVKVEVVRERNLRPCHQIGTNFAAVGLMAAIGAQLGQAPPESDPGMVLNGLLLNDLTLQVGGSKGLVTSRESTAQTLDRIRPAVASYLAYARSMTHLARTLPDSVVLAAESGEHAPLDSILARLQRSVERAQPGLSNASRVPALLRQRQAEALPQLAMLAGLYQGLSDGVSKGAGEDPDAQSVDSLWSDVEDANRDLEESARALQTELWRMERARARSHQVFTVSSSGDYRRFTISLTPTKEYAEMPRLRVSEVEAYSEPRVSVLCQISIGFSWMDAPPQYQVANGALLNTAGSESRTTPTLMFHMSPTDLPLLGALAGIGIGAARAPDFYAGGSLRYFDPMLLNVGVVWQKTALLPAGTVVGQAVPDGFADGLPRRYKSGLFIGASLAR
jgi:hypothetical protein